MTYPTTPTPQNPTTSLIPSSPLSVPTNGPKGTFTILSRTIIASPPSSVLHTVRDTSTWPSWNSFCPAGVIKEKDVEGEGIKDGEFKSGKGLLEIGDICSIDVFMDGRGLEEGSIKSRVQEIEICVLENIEGSINNFVSPFATEMQNKSGYRISWKSLGFSSWQLQSERVMEFYAITTAEGVEGTEYICWETFGGLLGSVVKMTVGNQLIDRFGDYSRDLKGFCEKV